MIYGDCGYIGQINTDLLEKNLEITMVESAPELDNRNTLAPLLSAPSNTPTAAWLPAFFLPHLATEIIPSVGGLIFFIGLIEFFVGAFQIYYAKFRRRGVVRRGLYARVRHPQYSFLALAGLGLLIVWPRFILLIIYVNMLWFYYLLARSEEERMRSRYADVYVGGDASTRMFLPGEPGARLVRMLFSWVRIRRLRARFVDDYGGHPENT
jgi:protein-S-isoprenylcysteine O-methyltransferase Ste14